MIPFIFFGTPQLSAEILEHLKQEGFSPSLIVTNPDKPQGRKMIVTPPPVKLWALQNNIPLLQPENLSDPFFIYKLKTTNYQLFIVVAYGKIIPKEILAIPRKGALNIHYSLLPKYRGASPIETTILKDDRETGVSILLLDEKMDHGPIIAQRGLEITRLREASGGQANHPPATTTLACRAGKSQNPTNTKIQNSNIQTPIQLNWPPKASELRKACNKLGAELLTETIPLWVDGKIKAREQNHSEASYTKMISKEDGLIDLQDDPYQNFLKIQAYDVWPRTYFFADSNGKKKRVIIADASFSDGKLTINRVTPEGKREMKYADFLNQKKN